MSADPTAALPYDLFVSYAPADRRWVEQHLAPQLDGAGIRWCAEADFRIGAPQLDEFARAVQQSRWTLLVLSPAYLTTQLTAYTQRLAQFYGVTQGTWRVLPLLLVPVDLPPSLAMLTPLDATDPASWPRVLARLCAEVQQPLHAPAPAAANPVAPSVADSDPARLAREANADISPAPQVVFNAPVTINGGVAGGNIGAIHVTESARISASPATAGAGTHPALHFDCGQRVAEVRQDIRLSRSHFVEVLGYHSEKAFARLEAQQEECPAALLAQVSQVTGVSVTWLQHGEGPKYPPQLLTSMFGREVVQQIQALRPEALYLCTDAAFSRVVLAIQQDTYRWVPGVLGWGLDFWNWWDDFGKIPFVYGVLNHLHTACADILEARIYPRKQARLLVDLEDGRLHPSQMLDAPGRFGFRWGADLCDLDDRHPTAHHYGQSYRATAFARVQDAFRAARAADPEIWALARTGVRLLPTPVSFFYDPPEGAPAEELL